jgi:hypothetical protein
LDWTQAQLQTCRIAKGTARNTRFQIVSSLFLLIHSTALAVSLPYRVRGVHIFRRFRCLEPKTCHFWRSVLPNQRGQSRATVYLQKQKKKEPRAHRTGARRSGHAVAPAHDAESPQTRTTRERSRCSAIAFAFESNTHVLVVVSCRTSSPDPGHVQAGEHERRAVKTAQQLVRSEARVHGNPPPAPRKLEGSHQKRKLEGS